MKLIDYTIFENEKGNIYFECYTDLEMSFNIYFNYNLPCYPVNHIGFDNIRYCTEIEIYDYDMIYDIMPFYNVLKEFFLNAKINIL